MATNDQRAISYSTSEILDKLLEISEEGFNEFFNEIMSREPFSALQADVIDLRAYCEKLEEQTKGLNALIRKHIHTDKGIAILAD